MKIGAPISAIIATRNRSDSLARTLESLKGQQFLLGELIVVDASDDDATRGLVADVGGDPETFASVRWVSATTAGAAAQRNQGVEQATQPFIWFFDDDVRFESNCAERLWRAIESDPKLGGVNAMIVNQRYHPPGLVSRTVFSIMNGGRERTYAGKVIGPAINLLPEDRDDLPLVVPVEWLNTTCTIYRREALPSPAFDQFFEGYSLMEDVALSLRVGQRWKLANVRDARIVHDSQGGKHKENAAAVSAMELRNRFYVMTSIMRKKTVLDYLRLTIWELFTLVSSIAGPGGRKAWRAEVLGKWRALHNLASGWS